MNSIRSGNPNNWEVRLLNINDAKVCPICGAFLDGKGYCANGHCVVHPVTIKDLEKTKLEIGNPDHINMARQYEISKGYSRDTNMQAEPVHKYKVSFKLTYVETKHADIIIESNKDEVEEDAIIELKEEYSDADSIRIIEISEVENE